MRVHVMLLLALSVRSTHHEAASAAHHSQHLNGNRNGSNNGSESGETEFAKRGYNEPCACDSDCDFGKWLTCQNGYCLCARNSFIYDFTRHICVVRLGEKCFEIAQEYVEYNPKDLPSSIRCVEGAFCSMSAGGVCACNTYGYYQSLEGTTCQRKKVYGQPCTRSLECNSDVCSGPEGKCICNIGEFYHKRRRKCVSLAGAICFGDDDCLDNGICLEGRAVCGCGPGYLETSSKTCEMRLNYGDTCSETKPCNTQELACIDNQCLCKFSNYEIFDNSSATGGSCLSAPGGPCVADSNCGRNSKCVQIDALYRECQCLEGHLEMPSGHCEKFGVQGEPCQTSSDCDPIPPLVCVDGRCDCRDGLAKYDKDSRTCRGLVGSRCNKKDSHEYSCTNNAMCSQPNPQLPGKCRCKENFTVSRDRTCVPTIN